MKLSPGMLAVALVSVILGTLGLVAVAGAFITGDQEDLIHWRILVNAVLFAVLVLTGLGLLRLRNWALFSAWAYVVGQLMLAGTVIREGVAEIGRRPWIIEPWMCEPPQLGGLPMTVDLMLTAAMLATWPLVLLVFLRRPRVREQLKG